MSKKRRRKRRLKKKFKLLFLIIIIIVIGITTISLILNHNKSENDLSNNKEIKNNTKNKNKEESYSLSLVAVGDYLIHSSVYNEANRYADGNGYDFKPMIKYIKEKISDYDLKYYNQETILGGSELGLSDYPTFNSPYEAGDAMIDAGFNIVSLATNHTMDSGKKAVENSCKYWKDKNNILTAGSYCSTEERNKINIQEKNNIKYTMLNYTYGTNGMPVSDDYLVNVWPTDIDNINNPKTDTKYQAYKDQIKKDIEAVRDKVDVLIVAMHWGVEYTHEPTEYEKDMANYLSKLGVNVIIGTHPHVIQPVTWINDTLVIYSLGNFISAQYQNQAPCTNYKCTTGLMTNFTIEKKVKGNDSNIEIKNVENELIYNYYNQQSWRGFMLIPFSNPDIEQYLPNYKEVYNTYKNVVTNLDDSIYVKEAFNQ